MYILKIFWYLRILLEFHLKEYSEKHSQQLRINSNWLNQKDILQQILALAFVAVIFHFYSVYINGQVEKLKAEKNDIETSQVLQFIFFKVHVKLFWLIIL